MQYYNPSIPGVHFFKIIEFLLSTYTVNKKNTGKPRVLVTIIALVPFPGVVVVRIWSLTEFTTQVQRGEAINNFV